MGERDHRKHHQTGAPLQVKKTPHCVDVLPVPGSTLESVDFTTRRAVPTVNTHSSAAQIVFEKND